MASPGELTRRYFANTLAHALLRAASTLAGLWAARELLRSLGPIDFGLFTLSSAFGGYLAFLGLGLPSGIVRRVADLRGREGSARLRRLVHASLLLFTGVGIAGAGLLALFVAVGGTRLLALPAGTDVVARSVLLATAGVALVSWPLSVFSATLTGLQRIPSLNLVAGVAALVAAGVSVAVARAGHGPAAVVLATGAVLASAGLAQAVLVHRAIPPRADPSVETGFREEVRPLLSFGIWVLALEIAALLIYQTDQLLLGMLVSVQSLTAYYIAARLHNLLREANSVLGSALFPLIAEEEARGNQAAAEQAIYRGTRYAAAFLAPATVAVVLLAEDFLRVWMGDGFAHLAPLAQAFAAYWLLAVLTSTAGQVAMGRGESAILGKIALICASVNLVVSLALVRPYGIAGVIAGTLVAYAIGIPMQFALLFPRLGIDRRRFAREVVAPVYAPLAVSALAAGAVLRFVPDARGIADLLARGALVGAACWLPLWFSAIVPRDRARILGWLREGVGMTSSR